MGHSSRAGSMAVMDIASATASTSVRVVLTGRMVWSLLVVRARAGSRRSITVPSSARSVRSVIIQTIPIRVSLLLLYTLSLVRVGRCAIVGIAIAASAGGVVLGRVEALARVITRDTINQRAEDAFVIVRGVAGAGAIDVADAAAAGRVNVLVGVVVLDKLAVGFVPFAFVLRFAGIAGRRANVSGTATASVNDVLVVRVADFADFTATRGAKVIGALTSSAGDGVARLRTNITNTTSSTGTLFECEPALPYRPIYGVVVAAKSGETYVFFTTTGLGSGHS
jgi:hypothetical protein